MYVRDTTESSPALRVFLNTETLFGLPEHSMWPGLTGDAALMRVREDGFAGVQVGSGLTLFNSSILPQCGHNRINHPHETDAVFRFHRERGDICVTLHLGWGMESDEEIDAMVRAMLGASEKFELPAFIETHRATVTQDIWRTVELTKRIPDVRFNGDFSHYYCGQELVYGNFEAKLDFMQPIFDRVGFMHGRIASPGYMQAPIEAADACPRMAMSGIDYLAHFKQMWRRAMDGFKQHAGSGAVLIFAPELLSRDYYYARVFPGQDGVMREESDRYAQALLYKDIAASCFTASTRS